MRLGAVTLALLVASCVTGPTKMEVLDPLPVEGASARMEIVREKQSCGSLSRVYVTVDDRPVAALRAGQNTAFDVSPGSHRVDVLHHVIDNVLGFAGYGGGAIFGVNFGRYGQAIRPELVVGRTHRFVLRAKCFSLDPDLTFSLLEIENWPEGMQPTAADFVTPGKRVTAP